ncbi:MAG: nitrite/sulfite reductase, partial [Candidatus Methylomirabilales bacterium]
MTARSWKEALEGRLPEPLAHEIDIYEGQIGLRKQGKLDERVFAETRLRRGVYGQRYDNGQRHDGVRARELTYPASGPTKGPDTLWDAPGMQRIKIPSGALTPEGLEAIAAAADEYSDRILHVTTRQDFQLHYVQIDDTPDLMRRLAAAGITTREACGNTVRNVTCCPLAGVCRDEAFDVTPYSRAMAYFLLDHPDAQDFGRKFKTSFSGCKQHGCALANLHDLGLIARTRAAGGEERRGFEM